MRSFAPVYELFRTIRDRCEFAAIAITSPSILTDREFESKPRGSLSHSHNYPHLLEQNGFTVVGRGNSIDPEFPFYSNVVLTASCARGKERGIAHRGGRPCSRELSEKFHRDPGESFAFDSLAPPSSRAGLLGRQHAAAPGAGAVAWLATSRRGPGARPGRVVRDRSERVRPSGWMSHQSTSIRAAQAETRRGCGARILNNAAIDPGQALPAP